MWVVWRLTASTAEHTGSDGFPLIRFQEGFQVATEFVRESMAPPNSVLAFSKLQPMVWNSLCLCDNSGTLSGIKAFGVGVSLEFLS